MQYIEKNKHYKFVPSKLLFVNDNKIHIFNNDIYDKYQTTAVIEGDLIVCNDETKMRKNQKKIVKETYEEYLQIISNRDASKDTWMYNIINGVSEQESILYRDDKCIVIPSYSWDTNYIDKMHILCLPIDISLRTIRCLESKHIPLLQHMKKVTCAIIKNNFGIEECHIKMFFHYEPSTYHLHIHFMHIENDQANSSVEYSHELDSVIFNICVCSDYYKKNIMNKRV